MNFKIRTHNAEQFGVDWHTPIFICKTAELTLAVLYALDSDDIWNEFEIDIDAEDNYLLSIAPADLVVAFVLKALVTQEAADIAYVHDVLHYGCSPLGFNFTPNNEGFVEDYDQALDVAETLFPQLAIRQKLIGKQFKARGPIYSGEPRKRLDYFVEVK